MIWPWPTSLPPSLASFTFFSLAKLNYAQSSSSSSSFIFVSSFLCKFPVFIPFHVVPIGVTLFLLHWPVKIQLVPYLLGSTYLDSQSLILDAPLSGSESSSLYTSITSQDTYHIEWSLYFNWLFSTFLREGMAETISWFCCPSTDSRC